MGVGGVEMKMLGSYREDPRKFRLVSVEAITLLPPSTPEHQNTSLRVLPTCARMCLMPSGFVTQFHFKRMPFSKAILVPCFLNC
jgi:hypothetical protein